MCPNVSKCVQNEPRRRARRDDFVSPAGVPQRARCDDAVTQAGDLDSDQLAGVATRALAAVGGAGGGGVTNAQVSRVTKSESSDQT